ncbi:TetR family transcriptional regulator [uncultured Corynebacterium sp.]|uniref:TetR family transcriptional regulator n=1 Tax=uncultured Corynebacterium sp. TaxID=159447 RepID=UPI0026383B88|nr:TetR family transcriptional regulator [uncultured Corynebacterium sp.]
MRGFSAEQLLAVADEYCAFTGARVRSFSALVACAAIPGARVHGVPVFDTVGRAAEELAAAVRRMEPLTASNSGFAEVVAEVYRRWAGLTA